MPKLSNEHVKTMRAALYYVVEQTPQILALTPRLPKTSDGSVRMQVTFECQSATQSHGMKGIAEDSNIRKSIEKTFAECGITLDDKSVSYKSMRMHYTVKFTVPEKVVLLESIKEDKDAYIKKGKPLLVERLLTIPPAKAVQMILHAKEREQGAPAVSPLRRPVKANITPEFSHINGKTADYHQADGSFLRRYALCKSGIDASTRGF